MPKTKGPSPPSPNTKNKGSPQRVPRTTQRACMKVVGVVNAYPHPIVGRNKGAISFFRPSHCFVCHETKNKGKRAPRMVTRRRTMHHRNSWKDNGNAAPKPINGDPFAAHNKGRAKVQRHPTSVEWKYKRGPLRDLVHARRSQYHLVLNHARRHPQHPSYQNQRPDRSMGTTAPSRAGSRDLYPLAAQPQQRLQPSQRLG